jgi:hypothetical protein
VLIFIPIVRLLLVKSDFEQNLVTDMNITTKLMTPWSVLVSGLAAPFALLASFSLIASKWYRLSKKWYHQLKSKAGETLASNGTNRDAVVIPMMTLERNGQQKTNHKQNDCNVETQSNHSDHHDGNIYENLEEKKELLEKKSEKERMATV